MGGAATESLASSKKPSPRETEKRVRDRGREEGGRRGLGWLLLAVQG